MQFPHRAWQDSTSGRPDVVYNDTQGREFRMGLPAGGIPDLEEKAVDQESERYGKLPAQKSIQTGRSRSIAPKPRRVRPTGPNSRPAADSRPTGGGPGPAAGGARGGGGRGKSGTGPWTGGPRPPGPHLPPAGRVRAAGGGPRPGRRRVEGAGGTLEIRNRSLDWSAAPPWRSPRVRTGARMSTMP